MKVSSGIVKGMNLLVPKGINTRPMLARVKESLFDILGSYVEDTMVVDLFAGSGSLGIEALSRGAKFCYFVEKDIDSVSCLSKNIAKARFNEQSSVMRRDVFAISNALPDIQFHVCFFDPPYRYIDDPVSRRRCMEFLSPFAERHLTDDGYILLHYRRYRMAGLPLPPSLKTVDTREYGTTALMFVQKT